MECRAVKMANPFVKKQSTLQIKLLRSNGVEVNLQLRAPLKAGGEGFLLPQIFARNFEINPLSYIRK